MFNSFPQPKPDSGGGLPSPFDWSAYQTVYNVAGTAVSVPAISWTTFVDITGKGIFRWCRADDIGAISTNPNIRLTIDGQSYQFDGVSTGSRRQGNEINVQIPFKNSLKIEVFNSHTTTGASMICDYLYLLQQSYPNANKVTLLQQTNRKMAYLTGTSITLVDVLNIAGSGYLLGVRFSGYYASAASYIHGDITVDGVQKMTDRAIWGMADAEYKQSEIVGPMRFNSSLRIKVRTEAVGSPYTCFAWYSLD